MKRIFISGMPRSGTTYIGDAISQSNRIGNIHEPFNIDCGLDEVREKYPSDLFFRDNPELLTRIFDLDISFNKKPLYPNDSFFQRAIRPIIGTRGQFYLRLAKLNKNKQSGILIKDPIAIFGLKEISKEDVKVLILKRGLKGFLSSIIKLNWKFEIDDILGRIELTHKKEILEFYKRNQSKGVQELGCVVYGAVFFWFIADKYISALPDRENVLVVCHEDILLQKVETLRQIQLFLGLGNELEKKTNGLFSLILRVINAKALGVQNFYRSPQKIMSIESVYLKNNAMEKIYKMLGELDVIVSQKRDLKNN